MKKYVPNLITLGNLFCGCIAAMFAFADDIVWAGVFVAGGIFLDFFDGLAARLLNVSSELGGQLDSLADMVTSGLVPGIVMFQMLSDSLGVAFLDDMAFTAAADQAMFLLPIKNYIPFIGFLITAASCYRLAKFNIDTRQTDSFIGLPTPANAIFIISLAIILDITEVDWIYNLLDNPYFLLAITGLSCFMLNAELPLFALKFKNFGFKGNEIRWIFVAVCLSMIILLKIYAVPLIIILYVVMSVLNLQLNHAK
ncbi:CDP-alcohol phosphatidyltransferase family protein [Nonlabens ponticola]|uniref:Phosphatidylserine synthase n=1 Tax=Nonlabens ponticola TaxID=2496866 RepID=A0A3S9MXM4_9FLAO|nr:CDP-alcohol phosphatidyltransferase family protein [Nonlabens ponticola]AZQ43887.1 phosphatidylserine synthase [Nonlabens ponticola]